MKRSMIQYLAVSTNTLGPVHLRRGGGGEDAGSRSLYDLHFTSEVPAFDAYGI